MRDYYTDEMREAALILDLVKAGGFVPDETVLWCLYTLGDL
jgi:hypothetical protein